MFKKLNASKNRIQADTKRLRGLYKKVEKDIRVLEGVEHQEAREARRNELKKFRVRIEVYDRYVEQHEKDIHFIEEADISGLKSALSDLKTMRGPAGSTGANKAYDKIYRIVERIQQLKGEWKWLGKIEKLESLSNEQDRALIEGRGDARAGALG